MVRVNSRPFRNAGCLYWSSPSHGLIVNAASPAVSTQAIRDRIRTYAWTPDPAANHRRDRASDDTRSPSCGRSGLSPAPCSQLLSLPANSASPRLRPAASSSLARSDHLRPDAVQRSSGALGEVTESRWGHIRDASSRIGDRSSPSPTQALRGPVLRFGSARQPRVAPWTCPLLTSSPPSATRSSASPRPRR
jgi:hypothetical protein